MKKFSIIFAIVLITLSSCKKEEIPIINPDLDVPEFVGKWQREYKILGATFEATYEIDSNKIKYSNIGNGPGNAEYTINLDSYDEVEKRWIGHTSENKYYLIFFKDITAESITLYKEKVNNPNDAQAIPIPDNDTNQNYGWNTYDKK